MRAHISRAAAALIAIASFTAAILTPQFMFVVIGLMAMFFLATSFSKAARLRSQLRQWTSTDVEVLVWGVPLSRGPDDSVMTLVAVRAIGVGLHLYLRTGTGMRPGHLKIAQPADVVFTPDELVIGSAAYVQWLERRLPRVSGVAALTLGRTARQAEVAQPSSRIGIARRWFILGFLAIGLSTAAWLATRRSQTHVVSSAHFTVSMDHPSRDAAESVSGALEKAYDPVARRLRTTPAPRIRVDVYRNRLSYGRATGHWTASGNIEGVARIHLLFRGAATPQLAVHEFVHTVTLKLLLDREAKPLKAAAFDRKFASFPVWLWEAVACYEADQRNNPRDFAYVRSGRFPDLRELSNRSAGAKIYDVGYTIVELIESRWGHEGTIRLIEAYGNTQEALGVNDTEFVRLWQEFVETKYPAGQ